MSCPTCDHTMHATGCQVTGLPFFWCPRCGTFRSCDGTIDVPALVTFCRNLKDCMVESQQPGGVEALRILGILESVYLPEER